MAVRPKPGTSPTPEQPVTEEVPNYPLTVAQAARYSALREATIRQALSTGMLKTVETTQTRRGIDPDSLRRLLEHNRRLDELVSRVLAGEEEVAR
jgi:hypothetical protein